MFVLVTGGSGSGKSEYAERLLAARAGKEEKRYYIAAMKPFGEEGRRRVEKHRRQRAGRHFKTIERYTGLAGLTGLSGADVLVECLSNLAANEMFDCKRDAAAAAREVLKGISRLRREADFLVAVTNEVFSDGTVYAQETMEYIRCLGEINRCLAEAADVVLEVVCGIPVCLKGELPCV